MTAPGSTEGSSQSNEIQELPESQGSSPSKDQPRNGHSQQDAIKDGNIESIEVVEVVPSTKMYSAKNGSANGNVITSADDVTADLNSSDQWKAPDGGWGWVVVACALMISLIVDGLTYTFGLFLGQFERAFNAPKSTVALASSLQVGIYLMIGPIVSALTNRFGCRTVIICGSIIAAFAYLVSSASQNVSVLILTYGFLGGVGFGLMYLPSIVSVSIYFEEKRALATGIAVCGSGVGMFMLAPITEFLLNAFNWRWTLVLLGGLILNGMVFGALIRPLWGAGGEDKDATNHQIIGSGEADDAAAAHHFGSQRSRKESEGSSIFSGNARKDSSVSRHRTLSNASSLSGNKEINAEHGHVLKPLLEGVESIRVEVIDEPVSKKNKHPKKYSVDERSAHLLQPHGQDPAVNFSSSPAIHNVHHGQRKSSTSGDHHLSKVVSSASDLFHRLQESASHQTLDPTAKHLRARTPLGLSVVSLAASNAHLSLNELHRTRQRANSTTDKQSVASRVKSSCLDCLSPGARSIITEMLNFHILKNQKYWFVLMGNFFCMIGFYVPFVYIPQRATQLGIDEAEAAFLLSIIGISNTVGRVLIGLIVQCLRLDCVMVTTVALVISGAVTIFMPLTQDYAVMATLSAVFGICVAAYIALCSVLLCDLLGVHNLTNAFGYVILFRGVACIIGPPLAGAIIDYTGVFAPAFYLGGGMIVLGGLCHLLLYLLYFTPCRKDQSKAHA